MPKKIILPKTKKEALEAGVPKEIFDPKIHLHTTVVTVSKPKPSVNAEL